MRLKALVFVATLLAARTAFAPVATLRPIEGNLPPFEVQFNPTELSIDKDVAWTKDKKSSDDSPVLEFNGGEPKTLAVELMFDGFETKEDVYAKYISRLEKLALVDKNLKRPPMTTFTWGAFPVFKGVLTSVNVKYTMFMEDGKPVRATVNLKMREADSATTKKNDDPKH